MRASQTQTFDDAATGRGRALARLLVALSFVMTAVGGTPSAAGAFDISDSFPIRGPLYADPQARLLYQVADLDIEVRDLDTLEVKHTIPTPLGILDVNIGGAGSHRTRTLAAVDTGKNRLFHPRRDGSRGLEMAVVDGASGAVTTYALTSPQAGVPSAAFGLEGLTADPERDLLYAVYTLPGGVANGSVAGTTGRVYVQEIQATTGKANWSTLVPGCNQTTPSNAQFASWSVGIGRAGDSLYMACLAGDDHALPVGVGFVAKMKLSKDGSGVASTTRFPAPAAGRVSLFDPVNERMYLNVPGLIAVFDGKNEAWVGFVSARNHIGVNEATGRLYTCQSSSETRDAGGMLISDAGVSTPVPLGKEYPELSCDVNRALQIVTDTKSRRLFAPGIVDGQERWLVAEDNTPEFLPSPPFDPDAGAHDVDEEEGVTEANFSAQAQAYGTRVVWVGGPMGTLDNSTVLLPNAVRNDIGSRSGFRVQEASREVRAAHVRKAKLANDGMQGSAIAMDRDDRLETDLGTLRSHPQNPTDGPHWPFESADCHAFGSDTDVPADDERGDYQATSAVSCDLEALKIEGSASAAKPIASALLTVGASTADVTVERDPKRGAVAKAVSVARNIDIAGQVFIAEATSTAIATAAGRPGKANATYERTFAGVKIGGTTFCRTVQECDSADVIGAINAALGPRIVARAPEPDPEFFDGTPAGTTASVRQDFWQRIEEQALFDKPTIDGTEDLTMPAMELQVRGNLLASSGAIVQLAGVTATAIYRIFLIPQGEPLPPPPPPIDVGGNRFLPPPVVGPPVEQPEPRVITETVTEKVKQGVRWIFGFGNDFPSLLAGWALLMLPLYVLSRRRALVRSAMRGGPQ